MTWRTRVFVAVQRVLPQRALTLIIGRLARAAAGGLTRAAIRAFVRHYAVDMHEAAQPDIAAYTTFNQFFTRALRADARPLPADPMLFTSPADGTLSQLGPITDGTLVQAKGRSYRLLDLLDGDADLAALFSGGAFATIYLAPRNYHRVHMPWTGTARYLRHIPGALFSVNLATAACLPDLFCRNERTVAVFADADHWFALIMVGAMNVSGIELVYPTGHPVNNRLRPPLPPRVTVASSGPELGRGAEFGRFNLGSTVIVLASRGLLAWRDDRAAAQPICMGMAIGQVQRRH